MRGSTLTLVIISALLCLSSFTFRKPKKLVPPGTVQITETFFADMTEISNFAWLEYEWWTARKYGVWSKEHIAVLPDTLVWKETTTYNIAYAELYYRHPAFHHYPAVGISYEQATAYCKWRTERVKEFYMIRYKKDLDIEYRLPTKEEWELFCCTYPNYFSNKGKNEKGRRKFNYMDPEYGWAKNGTVPAEYAYITGPVTAYDKNLMGIYNTFGNVAEMITEKGICKGGSWTHSLEDCREGKDISYQKPTAWLGFRCVCVRGN